MIVTALPPPVLDASKGMSSAMLDAKLDKVQQIIKGVYSEVPVYDTIIPHLLKGIIEDLPKLCFLTPGNTKHFRVDSEKEYR